MEIIKEYYISFFKEKIYIYKMKELVLIELIKRKEFKLLKKELKSLGSKYVKNILEPYLDNNYSIFFKDDINYHLLLRETNKFNKDQSDLFVNHMNGKFTYNENNWNNNIYKFDILIPEKIVNNIENHILCSKENNHELYKFLMNNRNGVYCIIHKIIKFWHSFKNKNDIEVNKLYENNFDIKKHYVRISREEFKKYSENYIKILTFLEQNNIIETDHYHRKTINNKEKNIYKQGICKGYRINESFYNEDVPNFCIIRINTKKSVINLYNDYMSFKESLSTKDDYNQYFSEDENLYYLKNYDKRPKRIGISEDCKQLIYNYENSLFVTSINEIHDYVINNYDEIIYKGQQRGKNNIIDKIYEYLNFFESRYSNIDGERFKGFYYFLDRTGRFYTFFNHCPKEILFELFKLKNSKGQYEKLVEVDMRSCHINMLALLFNKNVLKNNSIRNFVGPELLNWFEQKLDKIPNDQLSAFKNLCSSANYYEKITELINQKSHIKYNIDDIKQMNMYFLYGNNTFNPIANLFKLFFPFVIEFLNEIKKTFNAQGKLSYLLMRLESYFFIDKGIHNVLKQGLTVLPRHDCYYVAESDAFKIKTILTNIYMELTEGDLNYIPSYEKSELKNVTNKIKINKKVSVRNIQLNKFIVKTREEKLKINLYINLYYKDFNEFLYSIGIKKLKVGKNLNIEKFNKIFERLIKLNVSDEIFQHFFYLLTIYQNREYEKYVLKNKKYNLTYLRCILAEYMELDIENKTIHQPVFIAKQKVNNVKIVTPYEFYLNKINDNNSKDRQIQQNFILY